MSKVISVVVPCHNRRDALALALEALSRQTLPLDYVEVIVVDQASHDGSRELVAAFTAPYELRLIEQDAKHGISVARNAGAEAARGDLILFLDADLVSDSRLLESHVEKHRTHRNALVCGRVLPYAPARTSYIDRVVDPDSWLDRGVKSAELVFYDVLGGHLSLSAETFRAVGPFDPSLRGFEDVEFAYRAAQIGFPLLYCPDAVAYHNHARSLRQRCEQAQSYERMVPVLLHRYPDLRCSVPTLRDFDSIEVRRDSVSALRRKIAIRILGLDVVRVSLYASLTALNRMEILPRLVRALYARLIKGSWYAGYRQGNAMLATRTRQ